jgi:23S rRNA (guanine2445-N2)-methyltransferase / 23S rRNA (guanine2069-N7)-methyltransferase
MSLTMSEKLTFYAGSPRYAENILAAELKSFGAADVKEGRGGVSFTGDLKLGYSACLWSRIAGRVYLLLKTFDAAGPDSLYEGGKTISWEDHLSIDRTFGVSATLYQSKLTNSSYSALVVKDSIADRLRDRFGKRPSVQSKRPDLQVHLHIERDFASVYLDLAGESLHRRGYRVSAAEATLKENVGASILVRARWGDIAGKGGTFIDPMCGSGTLPVEAAFIAADIAPGLNRTYYGFSGWLGHEKSIWEDLLSEARERREEGLKNIPPIFAFDKDGAAVSSAIKNIETAGLSGYIAVERKDIKDADIPAELKDKPGLIALNPPYGKRLGDEATLRYLYREIGDTFKRNFPGWYAAVLSGNEEFLWSTGLKADRINSVYNGSIECKLAQIKIYGTFDDDVGNNVHQAGLSAGAEMFANRIKKNLKVLSKAAAKQGVSSFRLYDADMPEYSVAIDFFEGRLLHVQEYAPPATVDTKKAQKHLDEIMSALPGTLDVPRENIFLKVRSRQKGKTQYSKFASTGEFHTIKEDGRSFAINLTDYIDAGIFLDHRLIRGLIEKYAGGRSFLNLFCYTGTATVYAAKGGAKRTTSVDTSRTYLAWLERNLKLNGITGPDHRVIRDDCIAWLRQNKQTYGLIFLDPPTFSNSKNRNDDFEVQRDHTELVRMAAGSLEKDGLLVFSNNYRRFKMDFDALQNLDITDITGETIPFDFQRNKKIHHCFLIRRQDEKK